MLIEELMTRSPLTVRARATIAEAREALPSSEAGPLLVTDDHGVLLGVVSHRDLDPITERLNACVLDEGIRWLPDTRVTALLAGPPLAVDHDDDIEEAAMLMATHAVNALPVVGPDFGVVGIVSRRDVLRRMPASGTGARS